MVEADGLELDDGGYLRSAPRPNCFSKSRHPTAADLLRIAWHLGNRHLPVQVAGERLRIRADQVIAEMVVGLGGRVVELDAPFDPEIGAYAGAGQAMNMAEAASSLPAARLAFAELPDRRVQLFARPRSRGRERRGCITAPALQGWIAAVVAQGSGRIDADILRDAHRAAMADDVAALDDANRRGLAYRGSC